MRNSLLEEQLKKTNSSHFKRYSEHDLKTTSINSLLITQSNAFSNLKFKSLKTKLPHLTNSIQSFSNSHSKVSRIAELANDLSSDAQHLNSDLQELKASIAAQRGSIEQKYDKYNSLLSSKVQRLAQMVQYAVSEDKKRREKIIQQCQSIRESSAMLQRRMDGVRQRVKQLQSSLGMYTGEDKYLI